MTVAFAQRTDGLRLEGAYQVLARAQELEAQGKEIVHLEIGEPDFPTPENIGRAAAWRAGASAPSSARGAQPGLLSPHRRG